MDTDSVREEHSDERTISGAPVEAPPRAVPHWTGWLLLALGVFTLPWAANLAIDLPAKAEAAHYKASWVGFDLLLCALLLRTGWSLLRHRAYVEVTAAMTAVVLVIDAWFDVLSASNSDDFTTALALALCVELPLAAFCLWVAARVEFERRRRAELMSAVVRRLVGRARRATMGRRPVP
jgi:hypothetical protein